MPKTAKINEKMTIGEVVQKYPQLIPIFFDFGLHCVGCFAASGETIEQGSKSHGINLKDFLTALNKAI
jgi:hybrid cluster-associated redox disulfide protein